MKASFIGGPLDGLVVELPKLELGLFIPAYSPNKPLPTQEEFDDSENITGQIKDIDSVVRSKILKHEYFLVSKEKPTYRYQGVH